MLRTQSQQSPTNIRCKQHHPSRMVPYLHPWSNPSRLTLIQHSKCGRHSFATTTPPQDRTRPGITPSSLHYTKPYSLQPILEQTCAKASQRTIKNHEIKSKRFAQAPAQKQKITMLRYHFLGDHTSTLARTHSLKKTKPQPGIGRQRSPTARSSVSRTPAFHAHEPRIKTRKNEADRHRHRHDTCFSHLPFHCHISSCSHLR